MSSRWALGDGRPVASLSDEALGAEAKRRRRARAGADVADASPDQRQVAQWLANLELGRQAGQGEIEQAYRRLVTKYEPLASHASEGRKRAAQTLLTSLREAYEGLRGHLGAK